MVHIVALKLPELLTIERVHALLPFVSNEKRERIQRFWHVSDQYLSLGAELIIRSELMKLCGIDNTSIVFHQNTYGKPHVPSLPNVHFNASHSGEWIICAFDSHPIGIDIEQKKTADLAIAHHFFTPAEQRYIGYGPEANDRFYELWALKESYIKAVGQGLSLPLDAFCITVEDNHTASVRIIDDPTPPPYHFAMYDLDPNYSCAVCALHDSFPQAITQLTWDDLDATFRN